MNKDNFIYPEVNIGNAKLLGLTEKEFTTIEEILGRKPNYVELGIFAALWSEHCSYKTSKMYLKKLPTKGEFVLQGPGENAGIVTFDEDLCVAFKIESHNHPSFIEPYQGAATGVGGILRDIFAMGARPEVLIDSLRFGSLENEHNLYLLERVVDGIADYGNCMGIPTIGGETVFEKVYEKNPLVNVFALGFVKKDKIAKALVKNIGDKIIYVGSKTGRDGIHGATMASESFGKETKTKRVNVQIGDPFTEKLLMEACLELVEKECIVGIQDMGAAGLTSSIFELATKSRRGLVINLDRVPLREEEMNPYEIMLSESQERMIIVAVDAKIDEIKEIFNKWDLSMEIIGEVTEGERVTIKWFNEIVADVPLNKLEELTPLYERPIKKPKILIEGVKKTISSGNAGNYNDEMLSLLSDVNIASKKWVYEQYDHMVRTNTAILPGSDASVIRVKGLRKGIAISADGNGRLCYLDPFKGAKQAVCEALLNIACVGAKPLGITNCLNFGNPENPEIMWQFARVIDGMEESCSALNVPIVSGNVSFYNETEGINVFPTPVIVAVGSIENVYNVKNSFFKDVNNSIILLGSNTGELGGSVFFSKYVDNTNLEIPDVDLVCTSKMLVLLSDLIKNNLIESAHDVSEGGLAIAIGEMCVGNKIGATLDLDEELENSFLFSEEKPRIIIETKKENIKAVFEHCCKVNIRAQIIGSTYNSSLIIKNKKKILINIDLPLLHSTYYDSFEKNLK
jgi:phosphoribosylformylglycinamidine synthase